MSYIDVVNQYSENNQFKYDHKKIFKQVQKAMEKSGVERTNALIDVLKENYIPDVKKYEVMRIEFKRNTMLIDNDKERSAAMDRSDKMAKEAEFLEEYVSIINSMAMDIDSSHEPTFMLGMDINEAKELVNVHMNAFTKQDNLRFTLKSNGWEYEARNAARTKESFTTPRKVEYNNATEEEKGKIKEAFICKEIVKEELKSIGFFRKYFTKEGKAMRDYLKVLDDTLKEVSFPREEHAAVKQEFSRGNMTDGDSKVVNSYIDLKYGMHVNEKTIPRANESEKKLNEKSNERSSEKSKDEKNQKKAKDRKKASKKQEFTEIEYLEQTNQKDKEKADNIKSSEKKNIETIESLPKPQTIGAAKLQLGNNKNVINDIFTSYLMSAGAQYRTALNTASKIYTNLQQNITDTWIKATTYETMLSSKNVFKSVYENIDINMKSLNVKDKLVASQKISDLLLKNFSSIAANEKHKTYGENYAIENMSHEDIRKLTDYQDDMDLLMLDVKTELGLEPKVKMDLTEQFNEQELQKTDPVKEQKPIENIKSID